MKKLALALALLASLALASVALDATAAPPCFGWTLSADFAGCGTVASPIELSSNVTMPGIASIANATTGYGLTVTSSTNHFGNSVALKAPDSTTDGSNIRWQKSDGTIRWTMGNNTSSSVVAHDFWLFDNTNAIYALLMSPLSVSYMRMGTSDGRLSYDNSTHNMTLLTNGNTRLTLADALATFAVALDMGTHLINNVVDPVDPQDAATKHYVDAHSLLDDCSVGDALIFAPDGEAGNAWQCAHDVSTSYRLARYVVATTNGGLAVTMDDTDTTARKAFVNLRADCSDGSTLVSGSSGATWSCSTTPQTGGSSGPSWRSGAGVPGLNCAVGDLYSNTSGSTSTTLYVCTATNTWTAK